MRVSGFKNAFVAQKIDRCLRRPPGIANDMALMAHCGRGYPTHDGQTMVIASLRLKSLEFQAFE
jgi:hypothetical protein